MTRSKTASTRRAAPAKPKAPQPSLTSTNATADDLPRQIGGFAILAPMTGEGQGDPMQAAMDAAVAEHNARELERARARNA